MNFAMDEAARSGAGEARALADKVNNLFADKAVRDGADITNEAAAAAIRGQGYQCSGSYLWQLRAGNRDNPTFKALQGLAWFFGVPVAYFFDDTVTDRVDEQLARLQQEKADLDARVEQSDAHIMAMRAGKLSPTRRKLVMDLLDVVYREELGDSRRR